MTPLKIPIPILLIALFGLGAAAYAHPPPRIPKEQIPPDMPADIRKLVEKLYSSNDKECTAAAKALGNMGETAACAAPFLASVLDRHKTCPTPNAAAHALTQIGSAAVEPTIVALRVGDRYARRRTFDILAKLRDARAVPALVSSIVDGFGGRRAETALQSIGQPALDYLLAGMHDEEAAVRRAAATALPAFASSNVVDVLVTALGDEDTGVMLQAGRSLLGIIKGGRVRGLKVPSPDVMFEMLESDDPACRRLGLDLLARTDGRWDEKAKGFIRLLDDADNAIRMQAIDSLGWFKEARVVDALVGSADDPDDLVRAHVAGALGRTGRAEAVVPLRKLVKDPSALVRENAMQALAAVQGREAVGWLVEMLGEEGDPMLRRKIVSTLGVRKDADTVRLLLQSLNDPDTVVRLAAVDVFAESGTNGIPALKCAATNDNVEVRRYTLDKFRRRYEPRMTPEMLSLIDDRDWHVREKAMGWLADPRSRIKLDDLEPIRSRLKDRNGRVRGAAIRILAAHGDRKSMAVFRAAVRDRNGSVAGAGVEACRRFGEVKPLLAAMKHPDWRVREAASRALSSLNTPAARRALAGLVKAGKASSQRLMEAAVRGVAQNDLDPEMLAGILRQGRGSLDRRTRDAIVRMGKRAVPPLADLLKDSTPGIRREAAGLLGRIADGSSVPGLIGALDDSDAGVRRSAAAALGAVRDRRAAQALNEVLADGEPDVRESAARALGLIGGETAVQGLKRAAKAHDWHMRWRALQSLGRLESKDALETLLAGLGDSHWYVRQTSADALGRVGGKRGVPGLLKALEDDHWYVRRSARIALFRISGQHFGEDPAKWRKWWVEHGR